MVVVMAVAIPFEWVSSLAAEFGATECLWRESAVSFSGFVAEVWFPASVPQGFACGVAAVCGRSVRARRVSAGPGLWCLSVPCLGPSSGVVLSGGVRGGRVRCSVAAL